MVASGIAQYEWTVDTDEVAGGEVRVHLGIFARDLEQASAVTGLAALIRADAGRGLVSCAACGERQAGLTEQALTSWASATSR